VTAVDRRRIRRLGTDVLPTWQARRSKTAWERTCRRRCAGREGLEDSIFMAEELNLV